MKQIILILALIYSVVSSERALNMVIREGDSCQTGEGDNDSGVSGCVDRDLYVDASDIRYYRYYDRCCYMRYIDQGEMYGRCVGVGREEYMDIVDTIHYVESTAGIKIYELNCKSSYLQFALVFALLSFLF